MSAVRSLAGATYAPFALVGDVVDVGDSAPEHPTARAARATTLAALTVARLRPSERRVVGSMTIPSKRARGGRLGRCVSGLCWSRLHSCRISAHRAIHVTGGVWGRGASSRRRALPAIGGRAPGVVSDRCGLPGLLGVAALPG